jgi:hypothetical protein
MSKKLLLLSFLSLFLVGITIATSTTHKAFALQSQPPTDASYYVTSTDTGSAYNLGCNQGKQDAENSSNSEVILDFGGQTSDGSGTNEPGNGSVFYSNAQIEAVAEAFSEGYYYCTGSDTSSILTLGIGTNNSNGDVNYSGGQAWANLISDVEVSNSNNNYSSQVTTVAANDMETGYNSPSATEDWVNGFTSIFPSMLLNYGDAGGCPPYGSCNNGWSQYDVWYVSWGASPALPLPEIYYSANAEQWAEISLYGAQNHGQAVYMQGPLDEYPADNSTLTASQAWDDLWTDLNNNSSTAQDMQVSAEIQWQ